MSWIGDAAKFVADHPCVYTRIMSNVRTRLFSILALLMGGALLIYVVALLPPRRESGQLDPVALSAFLLSVFVTCSSAGVLIALALHRRWPNLAGRKRRRGTTTAPALRQGVLAGLTTVALLGLAMLQVLDVAVLIVTLLLAGLVEAFWQSRQS